MNGLNQKQKNLLESLRKNLGNITLACQQVDIGRTTFYLWKRENPVFKAGVEEVNEIVLDWCESQLYRAIEDGQIVPLLFYLKCKGKKRGWMEKHDLPLEGENDRIIQSEEDRKLIAETRRKLALLDVLLVTEDPEKQKKLLAEFHSGNNN